MVLQVVDQPTSRLKEESTDPMLQQLERRRQETQNLVDLLEVERAEMSQAALEFRNIDAAVDEVLDRVQRLTESIQAAFPDAKAAPARSKSPWSRDVRLSQQSAGSVETLPCESVFSVSGDILPFGPRKSTLDSMNSTVEITETRVKIRHKERVTFADADGDGSPKSRRLDSIQTVTCLRGDSQEGLGDESEDEDEKKGDLSMCIQASNGTDFSDTDNDEESDGDSDLPDPASSLDPLAEDRRLPPFANRNKRRGALSAPAIGAFNQQLSTWNPPKHPKPQDSREKIIQGLRDFTLTAGLDDEGLDMVANAMPLQAFQKGDHVLSQGEFGRTAFLLISGTVELFMNGISIAKLSGRFIGESTMLFGIARAATAVATERCLTAKLKRDVFHNLVTRREMDKRGVRELHLRKMKLFEAFSPEQIAKVADCMDSVNYAEGDAVVTQGEHGNEMYVIVKGSCKAEVRTGKDDVQKHRTYQVGDRFGELAFVNSGALRAASVITLEPTTVLRLTRHKFERMVGPLDQVQLDLYLRDPRKTLADFYKAGDHRGPLGAIEPGSRPDPTKKSSWFSVYRPCSRDAIARMLEGNAVGKGLNIKGKSCKKNQHSGYVPFLQISDDKHKAEVEESPPQAKCVIYYQTEHSRSSAMAALQKWIAPEAGLELEGDPSFMLDDGYAGVYGLRVHERVVREAYIMQPPLAFLVGWDTGRPSRPAFMDMNLHSLRYRSEPKVVLYQFDKDNAMNPHGLLIAYAEATVKPVVSDFDTFTVGSKGFSNYQPLTKTMLDIAFNALSRTETIFAASKHDDSWNGLWLEEKKENPWEGEHEIEMPKYGFGDETSLGLIEAVIRTTHESGAVRHGAECFNFTFPQELDDEYLVVWEGYDDKPWRNVDQADLIRFLSKRVAEGYSFPINPVWPVRDPGWFEIFAQMRDGADSKDCFDAWFPQNSGLREKILDLRRQYPRGLDLEKKNSSKHRLARATGRCSQVHYRLKLLGAKEETTPEKGKGKGKEDSGTEDGMSGDDASSGLVLNGRVDLVVCEKHAKVLGRAANQARMSIRKRASSVFMGANFRANSPLPSCSRNFASISAPVG